MKPSHRQWCVNDVDTIDRILKQLVPKSGMKYDGDDQSINQIFPLDMGK